MFSKFNMDLKRSNSLENIEFPRQFIRQGENGHRSQSESSLVACIINDNRSDVSSLGEDRLDSTEDADFMDGKVSKVETKIDQLNKMLQEQLSLVLTLREDLSNYKSEHSELITMQNKIAHDLGDTKKYFQSLEHIIKLLDTDACDDRAKSLLDTIELKHMQRIDFQIKDSISKFLQSDELKAHLASATVDSLKTSSKIASRKYFPKHTFLFSKIPIEDSSRLSQKYYIAHFTNANSASIFKSAHRTSRSLRAAMEKHQTLLESSTPSRDIVQNLQVVLEEILQVELKEWREKLLRILMSEMQSRPDVYEKLADVDPHVPATFRQHQHQPAGPQRSIIEQWMKAAEIEKHIKEGNINKSFEEALSSSNLSLVMVACRAADPAAVFAEPCLLHHSVLLSLVQQLVTDMVHDTQLKCRYLEDAIIKLNIPDKATRTYLPLVVHEVRKHLTRFLHLYPSHVASRRITLIIMAANNLIK